MMTFEEFFLKKKIDLDVLQVAEPDLLLEFKEHYQAMGEKSFDHTKKYLFNNLRKDFLLSADKEETLKEQFKPKKIPAAAITEEIKATPTVSAAAKPAGFKPKFKAGGTPQQKDAGSSKENNGQGATAPAQKPPGFKPRFKPGITAKTTTPSGSEAEEPEGTSAKASEDTAPENDALKKAPNLSAHIKPTNKPVGFKPKFKAGKTTVKKAEDAPHPKQDAEINEEPDLKKPPIYLKNPSLQTSPKGSSPVLKPVRRP